MNKKEQIKKHKASSEYKAALGKFSAVIWTTGYFSFATLFSLPFWFSWFSTAVNWGALPFSVLFCFLGFMRLRLYFQFKHACIGYALGLDVDKRLLKNINKAKLKIVQIETQIKWWEHYLSKEGKKQLEAKKNG